ncbi:MAG: hypothetical protein R3F16_13070 [Myxococcota bacterium]
MRPIRVYTAFHANLDFSAIPDTDRPVVIERCYAPLLELPERHGIPIGFELSARTLEHLIAEDPDWVKRFQGLIERGLVEPIASGRAQIVAPLAPCEVNRANLALGRDLYEARLGAAPDTWFVSEQTWSDGLIPLYREVGAARLIMEWNNPAAAQPSLRPLRLQPARLRDEAGPGPILLWNDSILFQKVQRIAHGAIPASELDALLDRLAASPAAEALCLYGGDVEIFDYRPSRPVAPGGGRGVEMARLIATLTRLAADPRFEFVLPRDVVEPGAPLPEVTLGSAADPVPCKKQPRYNPTRWAVSGRDGFGMNTRAQALLRSERAASRLSAGSTGPAESDWVDLWRSDFRTRATEEKIVEFETRMGLALARRRAGLERLTPPLRDGEDLVLVNPHAEDWPGLPIEVPLRLPPGRFFDLELRARRGAALAPGQQQLEVRGRHRDGSLREVLLVIEPEVPAGGELAFAFAATSRASDRPAGAEPDWSLDAGGVATALLAHRGGALESVRFPGIESMPLLGTIAHGSFDAIAYTPDFYSGLVVAVDEAGGKETDLRPGRIVPESSFAGPIRSCLAIEVPTAHGPWRKVLRAYHHSERLDLIHDLSFHDARLASLRLGIVTLRPDAWDRESLRYGTVNGGPGVEWRRLARGTRVEQSRAVSPSVSAHSCLGATEGWVAFEDERKGLLVSGDRAEAAVAPMLDFADVDELFFCRLSHSAAETDETRATFVRGRRRFAFALEAYRVADGRAVADARIRQRGLVHRTEAGVGLSIGL